MSKSIACLVVLLLLNPAFSQTYSSQNSDPWFGYYFNVVIVLSILSIIIFCKRMSRSYIDSIPGARLEFEPFKYYTPKNKLHITWTPKNEVHTTGSIQTTNAFQTYNSGYYQVPNVQGSISSESITVAYIIRITYDGVTDIGDRNIRLQEIPNYLTYSQVTSQVRSKTDISASETCIQDSTYSSCSMEMIKNLSFLCCLCFLVYPFYAGERAKRKQIYQAELGRVANEKNHRHLAQLLEEADRTVSARVEAANRKELNNQQNNMNAGFGNPNPSGHIVLTMDQLQLLIQNAQQGSLANLPQAMNQNLMPHAPPMENNSLL